MIYTPLTRPAPDLVEQARRRLVGVLGEARVSTTESVLVQHGTDEGLHDAHPPNIVVWPTSTEEVVAVVRCCRDLEIPLVPFGAGTSLEGHIAALHGGVSVDLSRMAAIRDVRADDLRVTVEAGVTRLQLERELGPAGLFFPIDPGADATLGGMIATGASGTMSVRYGTMREAVLSLTVVLASGEVVRTRTFAPKSSAGYDLTHLFIGSEGTLGVITEATLRIVPIPEAQAAAICTFPTVDDAVRCVADGHRLGVDTARIELLDEALVTAVNLRTDLGLEVTPTLLVECHGSLARVEEDIAAFTDVAASHGLRHAEWTTDPTRRARLWRARHEAYPAAVALRPGARGIPSDVCVPLSRLADCIRETQLDIAEAGLTAPIVGHVGDGNFHVLFVLRPDDAHEMDRYRSVNDRLVRRAIDMDGSCTGEHGVGHGKLHYLALEHGEPAIDLMKRLKRACDPVGLMNPGKVLGMGPDRDEPQSDGPSAGPR